MYNREAECMSQYPYHVIRMNRVRGGIRCQCEEGDFFLKEYTGGQMRLIFLRTVLSELENRGFYVDTLVRTAQGEEFGEDSYGKQYTLRKWYPMRECDPKNPGEVKQGAKTMGRVIKVLSAMSDGEIRLEDKILDIELIAQLGVANICPGFRSEVEKKNREMKNISNFIARKRQKNDFDMEFRKVFYSYCEQGQRVAELEEKWNTGGLVRSGLSHRDFTHHNILMGDLGIAVVHFDNMGWDSILSDVAKYFRKILEKNEYSIVLYQEMMDELTKELPLTQAEMRQLYLRLAYPARFLKIANHYAATRKNHITLRDLEKLRRLGEQEEKRRGFLAFLEEKVV